MAITFPTFEDTEILTAEKLNAWVASLQDKFDSGFGSTDINWPLVAEDNLVMGTGASGFEITGGTKILKLVNAAAYDTLAAAVAAAGTSGCVFVPPNTTITTDGVTLGAGVSIIGAGPSSVIRANAGASYVVRTTDGGTSAVANLVIDGNDGTATAAGLLLVGQLNSFVHNVRFYRCGLNAVKLSELCDMVTINGCLFDGGSDDHIVGDNLSGLTITGCVSEDASGKAINLTAASAGSAIRGVTISGNSFRGQSEEAILVAGNGGYSANFENIVVTGNAVDGASAASNGAIVVGTAAGPMQDVIITGNQLSNAGHDGIQFYAQRAHVQGNNAQDVGRHGCNCTSSAYATVEGNNFQGATQIGIAATNAGTDVALLANNVLNCNTAITFPPDGYHRANEGAFGAGDVLYASSGTVTIPANCLSVGDTVDVKVLATVTAGAGDTFLVRIAGDTVGSIAVDGSDPGEIWVNVSGIVTGSTTMSCVAQAISESGSDSIGGSYTTASITRTAAITIDTSNSGASITKRGMFVRLGRGDIQ